MVHRKLEIYLSQQADLLSSSHFDFFNSVPEISEVNACSIWIGGLTDMIQDSDPKTKASLTLLKERYFADKKNGTMKRFWSDRKLEQEAERSQQEARIQTKITVNRTTARVMQSVEKNACDQLEKLDSSIFPGPALLSGSRVLGEHSAHSTYIPSAAGQKHPRDPLGELDEALPKSAGPFDESRPSSELLRTPLQSPTSSEPASPVQPFILLGNDKGDEQLVASIAIQRHGDDLDTFFTSATEHQHREYLLQALYDGKQLPRNCDRPDYAFTLPLDGKDWGPKMTSIYNATRQKAVLTFQDLDEIAILSGVLHVDEEHAHLSKDEILQIRRDVLQIFYTNAQQEEDLKRARAARDHWVTWCELWSSIELSAKLAADQGAESTLETTPVIDSIMAAYGDCKAKNILPVLFMALHVFRKFNTWSKLRSEADCAMAMVGPILEEVLQIQHEVKFTSANFTTVHGQERKQGLGQHGSSRQPDIVGCTPDSKEVYFGELKGTHAAKQDVNVDTLRLAIFAKDALDHLHCSLVKDPPLLTFQTKGRVVVFFLGAKQGNAIVHVRVSSVQLPSNLTELNLNQEFFFRLFQIQTLLGTTREYLKNRRIKRLQGHCPFPTLGTPERLYAMRSPFKIAKNL